MISLDQVVTVVVYIIVIGLVFGLLFWLLNYCGSQFPSVVPFLGIAKIILAILGVLVLIGVLLSLVGHPVLR